MLPKKSQLCASIVVTTNDKNVAEHARTLGVDVEIRSTELSRFDVILEQIIQASLARLESAGQFPDLILMLEPGFPFRADSLLDQLICQHVEGGFDTVFPAKIELNSCWKAQNDSYQRIDDGHIAQQFKDPVFIGLKGLGCVSSARVIREGELFGEQIGILQLDDELSHLEVKTAEQLRIAEILSGVQI